jgi:hypothetical protein
MIRPWAGGLCALAIAGVAVAGARAWLSDLLTSSETPSWQRPLAGADRAAPPVPRAPVRVVVLDGLARADAHGPVLDAFCARGMDLAIDVGFPTKSLPVQSVLWSGLTAQQSGVAMRNQLPRPIADTLPARVAGSRAVVESYPAIAIGVGFMHVDAPTPADFARVALDAVASDAPLVMVHVLAIDEAGHRGGRDAAYRATIAHADALVGELVARAPLATWLVLSDHGHLARGGHGDAEPEIRIVRGCLTPIPPGAPPTASVHLVDVSRHLHDTLGIAPPARAVGRPLAVAAVAPDAGATLPRVSMLAAIAAALVVLAGLAAAFRWGRPSAAALAPACVVLAYLVVCGAPSLSFRNPTIASAAGVIAVVAVLAPRLGGRLHPARVMALWIPAFSTGIAAAILLQIPPVRLPFATAWAQILVAAATPALLAGAGLLGAVAFVRRRTQRPRRNRGILSGNRTATSGGSDQAVRPSDIG